jgi:hypothetical protein
MPWPTAADYNGAVQDPRTCFADEDLRAGNALSDPVMGLPLPYAGNFSVVYQVVSSSGEAWAVKCFTREVHDRRRRYQAIGEHLGGRRLPFTVEFRYLEEGIRVAGQWYPVVKMRWVEGQALNDFVRDQADRPTVLDRLARMWVRLAGQLQDAAIAHGDLQHGNVLLIPGSKDNSLALRLVDYDGMWVPELRGKPPPEAGHANYQHPQRVREGGYDAGVDRFSQLLIYTSLRCLKAGGAPLWKRYDQGEDLLFRRSDFAKPEKSRLFEELLAQRDREVRTLVSRLLLASQSPLDEVPFLPKLVAGEAVLPLSAAEEQRLGAILVPTPASAAAAMSGEESLPGWLRETPSSETSDPLPTAEPQPPRPPEVAQGPSRSGRRKWLAAAGAVLACVALSGGTAAYFMGPRGQRPHEKASASFEVEPIAPVTVPAGGSTAVTVVLQRESYFGPVSLIWAGLPSGVHGNSMPSATGDRLEMILWAGPDVAGEVRTVRLHVGGGGCRQVQDVQLTVRARPAIRISVRPAEVSLRPGGLAQEVEVIVERQECGQHPAEIRMNKAALPTGVQVLLGPLPDSEGVSTTQLTLRASETSLPATGKLLLSARVGALKLEHAAELKVQVEAPRGRMVPP